MVVVVVEEEEEEEEEAVNDDDAARRERLSPRGMFAVLCCAVLCSTLLFVTWCCSTFGV